MLPPPPAAALLHLHGLLPRGRRGHPEGAVGNWSMSIWCFCFAMTLIISIVELCKLQSRFPFFWYNLPVIYACYAALLCLLAFIIYATTHVHFLPYGLTGTEPSRLLPSPVLLLYFMPRKWPACGSTMSSVRSPAMCTPCQAC